MGERLAAVHKAAQGGPRTALEIAPAIQGDGADPRRGPWVLSETLCYLSHLELAGRMERESDGATDRWRSLA